MGRAFRGTATLEDRMWVVRKASEFAYEMRSTKARSGLFQRKNRRRTVYGPTGRPIALVKVSGFGNTEHEFDNHQDAVARPDTVRVKWSEMKERGVDFVGGWEGKPLPPPDHFDAELTQLRARMIANPADQAAWERYRQVKSEMVAVMAERKRRRDKGMI